MNENTKFYVECDCTSDAHRLVLRYSPAESNSKPDLYLSYFLDEPAFWERIIIAIRYVLGHKSNYGHFGETIFNRKSALEFKRALEVYLEAEDRYLATLASSSDVNTQIKS